MMHPFTELGNEIEKRWRAMDYDEERFPALAADGLRRACLPEKVSAWDVLEWTLRQNELPRQMDVHGRFGDPPVTVFVAPRFYIDVYFWFQGTTSMHQHGFCGAFQVLEGSSIHSWYEFETREAVNSFMQIGTLGLKVCELLKVGDVQEIRPGRQYIHSLFHLDHPSVTIVVRTEKSPLFLPQFDYHKPGLAVDPFYQHDTTTKKMQAINALLTANRTETDKLISDLLADSDFHTTFLLLSGVHRYLHSRGLGGMFGLDLPRQRFAAFMQVVRDRHGDQRAEMLGRVFARNERVSELVSRRAVVTDPEHRFFYALLLNVDDRDRIFSLIKQRFPETDPIDKILDWSYDLFQLRVVGTGQNGLGIAGFDDFDLVVLESLLRGETEEQITETIKTEYPAEKIETMLAGLANRVETIRSSATFGTLIV
jgi:hypothetical protein